MRAVLTSIDGCLLDLETNSYGAARQALAALERRSIPLILISQRTRAEVEPLRTQLQSEHPFICEDGMGLYLPESYFPSSILDDSWISQPPYMLQRFGLGYDRLRQILKEVRAQLRADLLGYGDWTAVELAMAMGITAAEAQRMQQRQLSEVFGYTGDPVRLQVALKQCSQHLKEHRLEISPLAIPSQIAQWYLTGVHRSVSSAAAVDRVLECYRRHLGSVRTLGVGSGLRDLKYLGRVQQAVVLPGPQSQQVMQQGDPHWQQMDLPGPEGWNEVVLTWLEKTDGDG